MKRISKIKTFFTEQSQTAFNIKNGIDLSIENLGALPIEIRTESNGRIPILPGNNIFIGAHPDAPINEQLTVLFTKGASSARLTYLQIYS